MIPSNVYINGRFFSQRVTGVQRYARETLFAMDTALSADPKPLERWTLLVPPGADEPQLRAIRVARVGRLQGHAWEQIDLPWHARDGFLLNFGPTGPLVKRRQGVTVHDAATARIPQAFTWKFRTGYRMLVNSAVRRASLIVAVSEFGASEIASCFGGEPEKIRVSTEGWQHLDRVEEDREILARHGLNGAPFVLAVSSPTPNKNVVAVVEAIRLLGDSGLRFVLAGEADPRVFPAMKDCPDSVTKVGYVTDAELKALYAAAACFVFPSLYEGFGLPPLEAMACGTPVVASTARAVKEVCGDAARYFEPRRPEQLAALLKEVMGSSEVREKMAEEGHRRALQYSWLEGAKRNIAFVRESSSGVLQTELSCA